MIMTATGKFVLFVLWAGAVAASEAPQQHLVSGGTSFGRLDYDYAPRGEVIVLDDLPVYIARTLMPPNEGKFILWAHDIFGWNSGRTKELADRVAAETKYNVILPDFFRGEVWSRPGKSKGNMSQVELGLNIHLCRGEEFPDKETYRWETTLKFDWNEKLRPWLLDQTATSIGVVGNCWGGYVVLHLAADSLVNAGYITHPSHPYYMYFLEESEIDLYAEVNASGAAQFFCPSPEEPDSLRPGGLADTMLDDLTIVEYSAPCFHGFFNRGNTSDPLIAACVEQAYADMITFFGENV